MFALPRPRYEELPGYREALARGGPATRVAAMQTFLEPFQAAYARLLTDPPPDGGARIGEGDEALGRLQGDGFALMKADPGLMATLRALVGPTASELQARLDAIEHPKFRDGQVLFGRADHAEVYAAAEAVLEAAGVFAIASAYARTPLVLSQTAIQVNTERSTRLRYGRIDEAGLPAAPADYLHIDSALWPHQKALIYLDAVGLDEGPFRYVPGSHRAADAFELAVRKTNDRLGMSREMFMALPEPFRVFAEFGGHIDQDGPEARALLAREVAVFDDAGSDLILFDYHGVHRGGFVRKGVRRMLQCTFKAAPAAG